MGVGESFKFLAKSPYIRDLALLVRSPLPLPSKHNLIPFKVCIGSHPIQQHECQATLGDKRALTSRAPCAASWLMFMLLYLGGIAAMPACTNPISLNLMLHQVPS